ncbi:MAG: hypothetical protein AB8G22_24635 [Saprospiraceae bacterium]
MNIKQLLKLQFIYCLLGVLFNVISSGLIQYGGKGLTSTPPIIGTLTMFVYGCFLVSGILRKLNVYRSLMLIAILAFGYGGIIKHFILLNQSPELYASLTSGIIAISINIFGLFLNVYAALGKFSE